MSLIQATSLITSGVKSLKTGTLPDLTGTVNALSSAGVLSRDEATVVKAGLNIANSIEAGHVPSLNTVTTALGAFGILNKSDARALNKSINIATSTTANNITSNANKLLSTLTRSGVIDPTTSKLLSNALNIVKSAASGNINGVINGALKLAGVSGPNAKISTTALSAVPSTVEKSKASSGYETKEDVIPDIGSLGILTKADSVKLLKACQMAIHKKYVVNGKRNNWRKVHNRGEYGAYRMTISQLIDIDFLKPSIRDWAQDCIHSNPTGPGAAERVKSYAEAVQESVAEGKGGYDFDFAPYKRESANNLQYFFLYNPIPITHQAATRSLVTFVTSEEMQDKAAYYYLKQAFVNLSSGKLIDGNTSKETIAGLLAIALCSKLDDAIQFAHGVVKTNSDGIVSKYWYDAGWNALAETPKNSNSEQSLVKSGVRPPTNEISTLSLLETAKDLSSVLSGGNINAVVSGLMSNGIIPKDVGGIIGAGLGIAASVIKDKVEELNKVSDALSKAVSVLPAGAASSLKSISSISNAVSGASSSVPSISKLQTSVAGASSNVVSAASGVKALAKQVSSLASQIENTAMEAVGSAVGAIGASGKVDPASLSFIGESLKGGFGLANDPQTAVVNELNRRGLCPPGSTALLRASIDKVADPAKIGDLIASEVNKLGNVGSAIPSLNTKLIEQTGAKPGLLDKFEAAKANAVSAIGVSAPELTSLISATGTATLDSLKNQASSAASSLLGSSSSVVSGLDLANNITSVAAGAQDALSAASSLGAAAVSQVSGAASSAAGAVKGIAGNATGALNSASGAVTGALSSAAENVSSALGGSTPSVTTKPIEGQVVSSYLPVTPATVPETPQTGTASSAAVPALPATKVAAAVGGTQASTPPVDPNPIKTKYGSVEVAYQWTASNGVVTVYINGVPMPSVNLIDKTDTNTAQYKTLIAAIDGAIKQERINNYTPRVPKTFEQNLGNALYPQNSGALPLREIPIIATVISFMSDHAIKVDGLKPINYKPFRTNYIIPLNRPEGTESIDAQLTREIEYTQRDIVELKKEVAADPTGSTAKWDLPTAEAWLDVLNALKREQKNIIFNYNKWVRDTNNPPLGPDTAISNDLAAAKTGIAGEYTTNLEKVKKTFSNNTPVAAQGPSKANDDGSTTTTVTEKFGDGSEVKTTIVEDQKGFVSKEKVVTRVAPPIATPAPNTNPPVADTVLLPGESAGGIAIPTPPSANSIPVVNDTTNGFTDPRGQYPKMNDLGGKPDTNSLAIGVNSLHIQNNPASQGARQETLSVAASPAAKNALRKKDIPTAGRNGASWSQPESPYAAEYPYNKVNSSESGHVTEIDDTPGAERLHTAHKSGTFTEIGPNGTQVTRIVGDNYTIVDSNGYILIEGRANVHVAGECNVMIMGDANLTMNGKVNMDVHNDFNLNVAGHFGLSVGGGIFVRNDGAFSLENKGDIEVHGAADQTTTIDGKHNLTASEYRATSKGDYHVKVAGVSYHTSVGNINQDTDGSIMNKAAQTIDSKSGTHTNIESLGNTNIKSAGSVNTESIAATNIKSANVINAEATDSINVKSANAVNVKSAAATNVKSGAAVNVEGAGNINLKAPLVASSPIDTPTLDASTVNVSTLNAGTTNLKGTDPQGGEVTPIQGSTSASVTAPGSAADAGSASSADPASEATGAQIATLATTIPVEKPVSISASPIVAGADGNQTTGTGGGGEPLNTSGGGAVNRSAHFEDDVA